MIFAPGTIVAIDCIDMSYYADTVSSTFPFALATMTIYGKVMRVDDECVAVAHQVHSDDGQVRHVSVIPRSTIISSRLLHEKITE